MVVGAMSKTSSCIVSRSAAVSRTAFASHSRKHCFAAPKAHIVRRARAARPSLSMETQKGTDSLNDNLPKP